MFCNIPLMGRFRKEKMQSGVAWRPEVKRKGEQEETMRRIKSLILKPQERGIQKLQSNYMKIRWKKWTLSFRLQTSLWIPIGLFGVRVWLLTLSKPITPNHSPWRAFSGPETFNSDTHSNEFRWVADFHSLRLEKIRFLNICTIYYCS